MCSVRLNNLSWKNHVAKILGLENLDLWHLDLRKASTEIEH